MTGSAATPTRAPTRHIVMLQALHTAPERVAEVVSSLPMEAYAWHPEDDAWNLAQSIAHLSAAEAPFLQRLIRIVNEDDPWLPYFGPDVARPESGTPLPELLAQFRTGRDRLLDYLSKLPPEAWDRPARHETMGPTTLAHHVQNILNHDAEHLEQLYALREAWRTQVHV